MGSNPFRWGAGAAAALRRRWRQQQRRQRLPGAPEPSFQKSSSGYNIFFDSNWWVLGTNGNRWSDPGRCWEPQMTGYSGSNSGHVLSQGCTDNSEAGVSGTKMYLYVQN